MSTFRCGRVAYAILSELLGSQQRLSGSELAERTGIDGPTIYRSLARLTRHGFLEIHTPQGNGGRRYSLTDQGVDLADTALPPSRLVRDFLAGLPVGEVFHGAQIVHQTQAPGGDVYQILRRLRRKGYVRVEGSSATPGLTCYVLTAEGADYLRRSH